MVGKGWMRGIDLDQHHDVRPQHFKIFKLIRQGTAKRYLAVE